MIQVINHEARKLLGLTITEYLVLDYVIQDVRETGCCSAPATRIAAMLTIPRAAVNAAWSRMMESNMCRGRHMRQANILMWDYAHEIETEVSQ